ncbi:dolichyl pyrophosphate Glc1Man9GlcNAc2 alpha-1,3-glucosyltransferase [Elsinoe australis]|uniref:Alpha-1,3-glucosyltransferase n=1 Tax=Elsinoe australis TaxID=40998 RepID=A0A4U7B7R7_9PEZI|nr:dolichyl pyrophosphate Glc1Man9GlcNAc2 alpha-1,3-glucosyltransferase [Elsinoe australis]
MSAQYPTLTQAAVLSGALKVLLWPAYKSTDFEVHRNWLAITHSLPIRQWYYEKTSEWTLDYPPFFAYFEWIMSQAAQLVDRGMLVVENLGHDSWQTVFFQRSTVIISESVLLLSLYLFVKSTPPSSRKASHAAALSILLSPGLLLIDHIHFQYNGAMYALLCIKHIYLYLAPAYFVFLLRAYCLSRSNMFVPQFLNCIKLGVGIIAVFGIAFGPFVYWGQMDQLLARLFPFSRGLCHAYWAPNVWAMYSFSDRVLIYLAPYLKLRVQQGAVNSVTRGLVGDTAFAVLPDITPRMTFVLTLMAQIPALIKVFLQPTWDNFVGGLMLCGYASFLFGWHVHEKAVLLVVIPFSLLALKDRRYLGAFRPLAVSGHVSLFPLLFTAQEFPIKVVYTVFWLVLFLLVFDKLAPASNRPRLFLLDRLTVLYIAIAIPLILYCSLVHQIIFGAKLEFLPLMFISSYSAIGVFGSWLGFLVVFFTS